MKLTLTQVSAYPENSYRYYSYYNNHYTLTWDNGLVLYSNKANGDGKYGPIVDSRTSNSLNRVNGSISGQDDVNKLSKQKKMRQYTA